MDKFGILEDTQESLLKKKINGYNVANEINKFIPGIKKVHSAARQAISISSLLFFNCKLEHYLFTMQNF